MSEIRSDVLAAVESALKSNPGLSSKELQEQAAKVDKSVSGLTGRQFHARYALQAKRKLSGATKGATKKRAAKKKATRKASAKKATANKATAREAAAKKSAPRKAAGRKAAAKKAAPKRTAATKPAVKRSAAKRSTAKRKAATASAPKRAAATTRTNDPVRALLREQFEERRATLDGALDAAFKRALAADSLAKINDLLASLERQASEIRSR